jgi:hypothetical protein
MWLTFVLLSCASLTLLLSSVIPKRGAHVPSNAAERVATRALRGMYVLFCLLSTFCFIGRHSVKKRVLDNAATTSDQEAESVYCTVFKLRGHYLCSL